MAAFLALLAAVSCKEKEGDGSVKGIVLSDINITIPMGKTFQVKTKIIPKNAVNQNVMWESSDPSVASVDNGLIKGLKDGKTQVTVTTLDGFRSAYCNVTVATVKPEKVIPNGPYTIEVGQSVEFDVSWEPSDANMGYSFSTNNKDLIEIEDIKIKGLKAGTANLTITTFDKSISKSVTIYVVDKIEYPTSIRWNIDEDYQAGTSFNISARSSGAPSINWYPAATTNFFDISISSTNENIASVKDLGVETYEVSMIASGTAKLTASAKNSKSWTSDVKEIYVHNGKPEITFDRSDPDYWYNGSRLILAENGTPYKLIPRYSNITHQGITLNGYMKMNENEEVYVTGMPTHSFDSDSYYHTDKIYSKSNPTIYANINYGIVQAPEQVDVENTISLKQGSSGRYTLATKPQGYYKSVGSVSRYNIEISNSLQGKVNASITGNLLHEKDEYGGHHLYHNSRTLVLEAKSAGSGTIRLIHKDKPSLTATINVTITQ